LTPRPGQRDGYQVTRAGRRPARTRGPRDCQ